MPPGDDNPDIEIGGNEGIRIPSSISGFPESPAALLLLLFSLFPEKLLPSLLLLLPVPDFFSLLPAIAAAGVADDQGFFCAALLFPRRALLFDPECLIGVIERDTGIDILIKIQ